MRILVQLIRRNILNFLRDKASVFFSFLSVIIIILMYILFLGKMQSDNLAAAYQGVEGIDWLVSSWIMAGLLTVSTVTVPLGALGNLINDRDKRLIDDFYTSPISRNILALSYLISAWIIGFLMVCMNLILGQIYVLSSGGEFMSFFQTVEVIAMIMLSIMSFSSFFFFISIFMKTANSFGLLSTLVGTFIGFFGGIYIPIGVLGKTVQNVVNFLPTAHAVTLMRLIYMDGAIDKVFADAPDGAYDDYANIYGLVVKIGDFEFSTTAMIMVVVSFGALFYGLSVWKLMRSKL